VGGSCQSSSDHFELAALHAKKHEISSTPSASQSWRATNGIDRKLAMNERLVIGDRSKKT
jgi:hypothetical protein